MSVVRLAVLAVWCLAALGCLARSTAPMGIALRDRTRFEAEWRRYRQLEGPKALAVAGDLAGVYVSGVATGGPSQDAANDDALSACEQRRADRRLDVPCSLYAIGDHPVAGGTGIPGAP